MPHREIKHSAEQLEEHLKVIEYFAVSIFQQNSVDDILWDIAENCVHRLGFVDCVLYIVDEQCGMLVQKAAFGNKRQDYRKVFQPIEIPIGKGIVGSVALTGKPELVQDVSQDKRYIVDDLARASELAVPIISEGKVIGVIDSEHPDPGFFTSHHERVVRNIAIISAQKIARNLVEEENRENARLHTENPNPVFKISYEGELLLANDESKQLLEAILISDDPSQFDKVKSLVKNSIDERNRKETVIIAGKKQYQVIIVPIAERRVVNVYATDVTDLQKAKQQAEKANKAKDEFLSVMSHEIRTPIHAVVSLARLMQSTELSEKQKEFISMIDFSANNLLGLVNDILDFEKIEAERFAFKSLPFNLLDQVQNIKATHGPKAMEKGIDCACHVDFPQDLVVIGDELRLQQILNNLISNALKFTHRGSVSLSVGIEYATDETALIRLVVSDTGEGIPPEDLHSIFDAFEQVNRNVYRPEGGTGLGLSITKRLVELQGGNIEVESQVGMGSVFTVRIPFKISEQELEVPTDQQPHQFDLNGVDILIVDDNEINLKVAEAFLKQWGAVTRSASNGKEAVEEVIKHTPRIVLMDIQMPFMDGFEATQHLRNHGAYDDLPILGFTADVSDRTEQKAYEVGMNKIITKPFKPLVLAELIRSYL
ncbi:MAG: ATP-binding protein [Flavobacteriales bacterium]|nr:ATP-binding protein [Flavobacteriales bacterium]